MRVVIQVATSRLVCRRLPWGIAAVIRPALRIRVIMLYCYQDVFILEQLIRGRLSLQELGFSRKINMNLANARGRVVRAEHHSWFPYLV